MRPCSSTTTTLDVLPITSTITDLTTSPSGRSAKSNRATRSHGSGMLTLDNTSPLNRPCSCVPKEKMAAREASNLVVLGMAEMLARTGCHEMRNHARCCNVRMSSNTVVSSGCKTYFLGGGGGVCCGGGGGRLSACSNIYTCSTRLGTHCCASSCTAAAIAVKSMVCQLRDD